MRARQRRAHRVVWLALSALLPAILLGALAMRRDGPREAAPVLLEAPPVR